MKFLWISRHDITPAQKMLVINKLGNITEFERKEIVFKTKSNKDLEEEVKNLKEISKGYVGVGIVAPCPLMIKLFSDKEFDIPIFQFINSPSARVRGKYLCEGVWVIQNGNMRFEECPLSLEEQEEVLLNPIERKEE